jgi:Ca2+-binding RTX toxin-like protein
MPDIAATAEHLGRVKLSNGNISPRAEGPATASLTGLPVALKVLSEGWDQPEKTMATVIPIAANASAATIQSAIDSAPAGAIVRLAAGSYTFSETVVIDRDDITVEGAGIGNTIITLSAAAGAAPAFQIGAPAFREELGDGGTIKAARDGATKLTMSGGDKPAVGDVVWISAENDPAFLDSIGDELWREDKPLRTAMAVVTAVNGNTVTLDRALPMDFPAGTTIQTLETADNVTLKGMTLKGAYGTSDAADFTNTKPAANDGVMVLANGTNDLRIEDLDIVQPVSNGIVIGKSIDPRVYDVKVTGAHNKGDGGNGYGLEIRDVYDGAFIGLTIHDTRHAVVFASYTSAHGNRVQVTSTNRDINFHGGLDTDNTVVVYESLRDTAAEQAALGTVVFYNPGTDYGAPTDPSTNLVTFRRVIGSVRADDVRANDAGAVLETLGGNDTLRGGLGNDLLDGGTGNDTFHRSGGTDRIIGGYASDTLIVDTADYAFILRKTSTSATLTGFDGETVMSEVEKIKFSNKTVTVNTTADAGPVVNGTSGYDDHASATSVIAGTSLDAVTFSGSRNVYFLGNDLANRATGNSGANLLLMGAGNDVAHGNGGRDSLAGGEGNDLLTGGDGDDHLNGNAGTDTMRGDAGADTFYASAGRNYVVDFSGAERDSFVFAGHTEADVLSAVELWSTDRNADLDGFTLGITTYDGLSSLKITSDEGDSLIFVNYDAARFLDQF